MNAFPRLEDLTMEAIAENPVHRRRLGSAMRKAMRHAFWDAIRAAEVELAVDLEDGTALETVAVGEHTKRRQINVTWQE